MNKQQKQVQQHLLNSEKEVLKLLEQNYKDALLEVCSNLNYLKSRSDADMQNVIYQINYQDQLKNQLTDILSRLHNNEYKTVSEYLTSCYEDGFLGTMYDLQGQGIPLILPIDQEQVVRAIQHDTKLSSSLYSALGKNVNELKRQIAGEMSRGISNGQSYQEIARNLSGYADISRNKAMRIARTEGHRIQSQATADAQWKAKEKGADVVKQWDASLDSKTRDTHRKLDGQIRELEEDFEVDGMKAAMPCGFGIAEEDINCRCVLLQRARWALGNSYTKYDASAEIKKAEDGTETRYAYIDANSYSEFKGIYKDITGQMTMNFDGQESKGVRTYSPKMSIDAPEINDKTIRNAYDDFNSVLLNSEGSEMMVNRIIMASDTVDFVEDNSIKSVFSYIPDADVIKYNSKAPNFELYDLNYVQAHELSHRIDMMEIQSWNNTKFVNEIENSRQIVANNKDQIINWFSEGGKYSDDVALSDIISALSNAEMNDYLIAAHNKEYWNKDRRNTSLEIFANIASIDIVGYDSKMELETMFRGLFDAYKEMVK